MIRLKSASEAAKRKVASMSVQRRRGSPGDFRAVMDPYTQARCLGGQRYLRREKKIRDALDVQRGRQDRIHYLSFANFPRS